MIAHEVKMLIEKLHNCLQFIFSFPVIIWNAYIDFFFNSCTYSKICKTGTKSQKGRQLLAQLCFQVTVQIGKGNISEFSSGKKKY